MATYYLNADSGNDTTGDGSSGSPWLTMLLTEPKLLDGDTVILQDSTATYAFANDSITKTIDIIGESYGGAIFDAGAVADQKWQMSSGKTINVENVFFTNGYFMTNYSGWFGGSGAATLNLTNCRFYGSEIAISRAAIIFLGNGAGFTISLDRVLIFDNEWTGSGSGLFTSNDSASTEMVINNSVIHYNGTTGNEGTAFLGNTNGVVNAVFTNSIFRNSQAVTVAINVDGTEEANHCCFSGSFSSVPTGTGNITSDPLFVDETNGNYNLSPSSPCIGTGTLV